MVPNLRKARMVASLAVALLATSALAPASNAGPISDMMARHRQKQAMKLPPVDKPFSTKPVRNLNDRNLSLAQRFKKKFSLNRGASDGTIPMNKDAGIMRTSR